MMLRIAAVVCMLAMGIGAPPRSIHAQIPRPAIGAGVGVAGGAIITLSAIVVRARFQREYIDSVEDLIHWQSLPMIATPAVGVMFGLAGRDALIGSIIGSTSGMLAGAAVGAGMGWALSATPEGPWAGGMIGAGVGLTIGGLALGFSRWAADDDPDLKYPDFLRFGLVIPVP